MRDLNPMKKKTPVVTSPIASPGDYFTVVRELNRSEEDRRKRLIVVFRRALERVQVDYNCANFRRTLTCKILHVTIAHLRDAQDVPKTWQDAIISAYANSVLNVIEGLAFMATKCDVTASPRAVSILADLAHDSTFALNRLCEQAPPDQKRQLVEAIKATARPRPAWPVIKSPMFSFNQNHVDLLTKFGVSTDHPFGGSIKTNLNKPTGKAAEYVWSQIEAVRTDPPWMAILDERQWAKEARRRHQSGEPILGPFSQKTLPGWKRIAVAYFQEEFPEPGQLAENFPGVANAIWRSHSQRHSLDWHTRDRIFRKWHQIARVTRAIGKSSGAARKISAKNPVSYAESQFSAGVQKEIDEVVRHFNPRSIKGF
jgi:hypothetical protein